jgi:hypothetical protein
MKKYFLITSIILILGVILTLQVVTPITPLILGGKSFEGRSEFIRFLVFLTILTVIGIVLISIYLILKKLTTSNRKFNVFFNTFALKCKSHFTTLNQSVHVNRAIIVFIVISTLILLFIQVKIITFPYPMEFREGSFQLTTFALLNHINPFSIENNPIYVNPLGVGYNLLILPFITVLGNTLTIHRMLNAIFILGALILLIKVMRQQNISWPAILIAGLFTWMGLMFHASPTTRPDTLGEFLFFLSLFLPFLKKFSSGSLLISAIAGIYCFLSKVYFFICVPIMALYLFLFISKKKAIWYGIGSMLGLILTVLLQNYYLETYFLNTIYPLLTGRYTNDLGHLIKQTIKFIQDYWGLLLIALIATNEIILQSNKHKRRINIDLKSWDEPLLNQKMDLIIFTLLICSLVVFLRFGWHTGTTQTYFYHLITPFMAMVVLRWVDQSGIYRNFLLLLSLLTLMTQALVNFSPDFKSFHDPDWKRLEQYIQNSEKILNSPVEISLLIAQGKTVGYSGNTLYYFLFPPQPSYFWPDPEKLIRVGDAYVTHVAKGIINGEYDLVVNIVNENYGFFVGNLDPMLSNEAFLTKYYHPIDTMTISMPHTLEEWDLQLLEPN